MKMNLFTGLLISVSLFLLSNPVYAEELELSTPTIKPESPSQIHVAGDESKLSKVNLETMDFIKSIAFEIYLNSNQNGLFPSVTIAQAILESNNGKSSLSQPPNHNLFGMKGSYNDSSVQLQTNEDDGNGNMYAIYSNFKKYPDKISSIKDHNRLIREGLDGYYEDVWRENSKTPEAAAEALQGTYASDTQYASKLIYIIETYNLKRFDRELSDRDLAWLSSDSKDPWEMPIINNVENNYELVEKYGIIKGVRKDSILISKRMKDPSGLHVVYKEFPKSAFDKLEFIEQNEMRSR